ncbi:hypothetical protein Nepgr_023276 [Nepenthes gracilis]|uniref:Uncharacterized protein n=1 Tax=Nepenthes gracilis TaxID=150966 RepID=A0AAD3XYW2_NEPGR|nr:hypothetical protein Nepgr_023276 [Nepenthes gracilis]
MDMWRGNRVKFDDGVSAVLGLPVKDLGRKFSSVSLMMVTCGLMVCSPVPSRIMILPFTIIVGAVTPTITSVPSLTPVLVSFLAIPSPSSSFRDSCLPVVSASKPVEGPKVVVNLPCRCCPGGTKILGEYSGKFIEQKMVFPSVDSTLRRLLGK